jgi:hypothetical protein
LCQNYCKREAADTDLGEMKTKFSDSQWKEERDADGNLVAGQISQPASWQICYGLLYFFYLFFEDFLFFTIKFFFNKLKKYYYNIFLKK